MADNRLDVNWNMAAGGLAFNADMEKISGQEGDGMRPPRGIFAEVPGSTPKYALNELSNYASDYREQMARLFLQVTNYQNFLKEFNNDKYSKQVAKVLAGSVSQDGTTSSNEGKGYIDFLLQTVQHGFQEKHQVVETLGDDHVAYFFGQGAPTFSYGGTLINTKQDDQAINMLRLYRDMGRGLKLAQRNTLISLRYDGLIVSGAMLNLSLGLNADMEMAVPFQFALLVKQVVLLPNTYAGVVQLSKPFMVDKNTGYLPFSRGLENLGTVSVNVVGVPPVSPTPAASVATEPVKEDTSDLEARKKLQAMATPKTTTELSAQAAELKRSQQPERGPKF